MIKRSLLGAAALLAIPLAADPAFAGPAEENLEQTAVYLDFAKVSAEKSEQAKSSNDKCIWARRALDAYSKALEYYEIAVQADRDNPEWNPKDRAEVGTFRVKLVERQTKAQKLVKDLC